MARLLCLLPAFCQLCRMVSHHPNRCSWGFADVLLPHFCHRIHLGPCRRPSNNGAYPFTDTSFTVTPATNVALECAATASAASAKLCFRITTNVAYPGLNLHLPRFCCISVLLPIANVPYCSLDWHSNIPCQSKYVINQYVIKPL